MSYTGLYLGYVMLLGLAVILFYVRFSTYRQIESLLFWSFGAVLVAFTGLRRFGVGVDDGVHYAQHYWPLCPVNECLNIFDQERDWLWYGAIAILKSIWPAPEVMLWLGAMGLFIKLFIIENLSRYRLLGLLIFVSVFYQTHDMTTFRQSFAELFFLLGCWLMVRASLAKAAPVLFMSGMAHQQAFLSPLVLLLGSLWIRRWQRVGWLILVLMLLIGLGLTVEPLLQLGKEYRHHFPGAFARILASAADAFYAKPSHGHGKSYLPVVIYPLSLWVLYTLRAAWDTSQNRLAACVAYCVSFSYITLWIFAGSEIWQYRLFYFYLLPIVFVVGGAKLTPRLLWATMLVAGIFVIKYNVLHETFTRPARINVTAVGQGGIDVPGFWVPCGAGCAELGMGAGVQLIPRPAPGYRFLEWGGDCEGSIMPCNLRLDSDKQVTAVFTPAYKLSVVSVGEGWVRTDPLGVDGNFVYINKEGADCFSGCQTTLDKGQMTTLIATPSLGYRFESWSGACAGADPVCTINVERDVSVDVKFVKTVE